MGDLSGQSFKPTDPFNAKGPISLELPATARPAKMDSSAPLGYTEKNRPGAGLEKTPMTAEPLTVDIWSDFV